MGMDLLLYRLPKDKFHKDAIPYDEASEYMTEEDYEKYCVTSWRKFYGLNNFLMEMFAKRNNVPHDTDIYSYLHRMKKKQFRLLLEEGKNLDSRIYTDTAYSLSRKERKRVRKRLKEVVKDCFKYIDKGEAIYYECSY